MPNIPLSPSAADEDEDVVAGSRAESASRKTMRPGRQTRSTLAEAFILVFTALLLALTLKSYVAEAYEIKGSSMEPTFQSGERVVILKAFYEIERGDVIIFQSTEGSGKDLIKRVVGLPGEMIVIREGKVHVDGQVLEEGYIKRDDLDRPYSGSSSVRVTLEPDEYFVLGDNRGDSHDSRRFRGVPAGNIKGKVVVRWWPVGDISSF